MKNKLWVLINKKLNNLKLEYKILLIFTFVNILIIGTFSIVGLKIVTERYNNLLYQSMNSSSNLFVRELSNKLYSIVTMSNVIRIDNDIQKHLDIVYSKEDYHITGSYSKLYTALQNYYQQYKEDYMQFSVIYNPKFTTYTYGYYSEILSDIEGNLLDVAKKGGGYPIWATDYADDSYLYLVRQIRKIENLDLDNLGTLAIAIDIDKLLSNINQQKYEDTYWIFHEEDSLIYHSKELTDTDLENITNSITTYGVINLHDKKYFALRGTVGYPNWGFMHLVSFDDVAASQRTALNLYIFMLLLSLIIASILMHYFLKKIMSHIGFLLYKMKLFKGEETYQLQGKYDYFDRKDEIGLLHQQFDSMANEIKTLIDMEYRNALLMKDAQIKALETQINPHFLYNTLESINWRAKAIGERQISQMVESMGRFLRLTLSEKNENFTLREELGIVNYYMTIQQIRFDERLHFNISIPNDLYDAQIPKLTIQPLVENAVHYALEQITGDCTILLMAEQKNNNIYIYVKNSGSSFEEDLLEKLANKEIKGKGLGIALLNIQQRIKLTFGENYGLTLYNENGFAVARVTIPII